MTIGNPVDALGAIWRSFRAIESSKRLAILVTIFLLVIVLPSGPSMERVFAAVVNPQRESMYANAFGEFLVNKDEIFQYFPVFIEYLIVSFVAVAFSFKSPDRRSFFISIWIWLSISITLMDIIFAHTYNSEINITFSALSNTIGGGLIAGICGFVFVLCDELYFRENISKFILSAAISIIVGISMVAAIYLLHGILFYTPSNYFQVEVSKSRAFFFSSEGNDLEKMSFQGFVPDQKTVKRFEAFNGGPVVAKLTSDDPNPPVDVEVYIFRDCDLGWLGARAVGTPALSFSQIRALTVELDSLSDIRFRFADPASSRIRVPEKIMSWPPSVSGAMLSYPYRVLDRTKIRLSPESNYVGQFSTSVIDTDKEKMIKTKRRSIKIKANGKTVNINLIPDGNFDRNVKLPCAPSTYGDLVTNVAATVIVKVSASENPLYFGDEGRYVDFDLGFGDFWLHADKPKESTYGYEGEASDLQIWGGLRKLTFGGQNIEIKNFDEILTLMGEVKVTSVKNEVYSVEGVADYAYLGSVRLNQTRWESISDEWRVWLIGGVFAVLLAILRFMWSYMSPRLRGDFRNTTRSPHP